MLNRISRRVPCFFIVIVTAMAMSFATNAAVVDEPAVNKNDGAKSKSADIKGKNDDDKQGTKEDDSKPRSLFDGKSLGDWKESEFPSQGRVKVEDGKLVIGVGERCSGVTYKGEMPTTNYELSLEAMRVDGSDFFCGLTFPVKPSDKHPRREKDKKDEVWPCTLIVGGWGGGIVGLSSIDGNDASENATSSYRKFESGKWYRIRVRVTENKIEAWIDKEKVVDLTIGDRKLSIRIEVEESKPLGIATYQTTGAIKNIEVKTVKEPDSPPEQEE